MRIPLKSLLSLSIGMNAVLAWMLLNRISPTAPDAASVQKQQREAAVSASRHPAVKKAPDESTSVPQSAQSHLSLPKAYLDKVPNYIINPREEIDSFYAAAFGVNESELTALNSALQQFCVRVRQLEKAGAKLIQDTEGNSFVRVEPFPEALGEEWKIFAASVHDLLGEPRSSILSHLIKTSPHLTYGTVRKEVCFTQGHQQMPILRLNMAAPGLPSVDQDIYLEGSMEQRADLKTRFGHLLDTDASIDQLSPAIISAKKESEARAAIIKSAFEER